MLGIPVREVDAKVSAQPSERAANLDFWTVLSNLTPHWASYFTPPYPLHTILLRQRNVSSPIIRATSTINVCVYSFTQ
ncbi:hypothetical protein DNHGIG_00720 [Collibacillus ludicampi]|uniref:Uncharacterized protein n=1 Tax=Collibacillus ludicampi TaxID=2771369 RepID=A0AAV4LA41_9BACL|nr:hypothetical protein DNHGIG_00720 [Collibacillus ludicampi]